MNPRWLLACLCAAALVLGSCVPPEESTKDVPRYSANTLMGFVQERGTLIVGYDPTFWPFSGETMSGEPGGFAIDLAQIWAEALGVDIEYVAMSTPEMMEALEAERPDRETGERLGRLDVGFPKLPLTETTVRGYGFTNPYFLAHQRLLVREDSPIISVDDLAGKRVCAIVDPATGVDLSDINETIEVVNGIERTCYRALRTGDVDAVTAHDAILLKEIARVGETDVDMVGEDLSTVGYGAAGPPASATFMTFASFEMGLAKEDGRFMAIYDEWLAPLLGSYADTEPPDMGVTEAAALYPEGL